MSPAAASVRGTLFFQAALTLAFALLRAGGSGSWTITAVVVAVAAVGLGAALRPTPAFRTAVIGFEAAVIATSVISFALGGYLIPATLLGGIVLVRVAQTSIAEFCAEASLMGPEGAPSGGWEQSLVGAAIAPTGSVPPWATQHAQAAPPPVPPAAPWAGVPAPTAPWIAPPPAPVVQAPPSAVPAQPVIATPAALGQPSPFLPPRPGEHAAGRTVLPQPPQAAPAPAPPPAVPGPPPAPVVPHERSPLEDAARELASAAAPVAVAPEVPAPPAALVASQCMTILPG